MKLKSGLTNSSSDPWYDLSSGGYLNPNDMCERKEDADRVVAAVKVIEDFFDSCESQIDGFLQ